MTILKSDAEMTRDATNRAARFRKAIARRRLDELLARETCFRDFDDLLNARGGYRPTIDVSTADRLELADAYDAAMIERGDLRRAFRTGDPSNARNRSRRVNETVNRNNLDNVHAEALRMNREFDLDNEALVMTRSEIEKEIATLERDLKVFRRGQDPFGAVGITERNLEAMRRLLKRAPFESAAQFAKSAKAAARECIESARNDRNRFEAKTHFTHRGVDIVACNADGERCGDGSPIILDLNQVSGKQIKLAVEALASWHGDDFVEVSVQGGIDAHESFADFMRDARDFGSGDYDPQVSEWDVSAPRALFGV